MKLFNVTNLTSLVTSSARHDSLLMPQETHARKMHIYYPNLITQLTHFSIQFTSQIIISTFLLTVIYRVMTTMVLLLMALSLISILPLLTTALFHVKGSVYCDTCRAGFETNATFYIQGITKNGYN